MHRLEKVFGAEHTYQLAAEHPSERDKESHEHLSRRILFGEDAGYERLLDWVHAGGQVEATLITEEFGYEADLERQPGECLPMFVITASGKLSVIDAERRSTPVAGDTVVALVDVEKEPV